MLAHKGLILHVTEGPNAASALNWFANPAAQASAHFVVDVDGTLYQVVDTNDKAWAEAAGNPYWVSVEIAGYSGNPATPAQVKTIARLYAWLHGLYQMPFQLTDDPNGSGIGWHGMGGTAWGGHLQCPGDPIKNQRPQIIQLAQGGLNPLEGEVFVSRDPKNGNFALVDAAGAVYTFNANGTPGGNYLGGLNNHPEYNAGQGKPMGPVVGVNHYDDGNASLSAYVIVTRDSLGAFHGYNFPSNGILAK